MARTKGALGKNSDAPKVPSSDKAYFIAKEERYKAGKDSSGWKTRERAREIRGEVQKARNEHIAKRVAAEAKDAEIIRNAKAAVKAEKAKAATEAAERGRGGTRPGAGRKTIGKEKMTPAQRAKAYRDRKKTITVVRKESEK